MTKFYEKIVFFPLTNSLNVRASSKFIESDLINSFKSKFKSFVLTSLNNLCKANPFPLANNSFNLSDDSESILKN